MNVRLKKIREYHDLSQQEFASKIALSRGYLANIEIGKQELNDRLIKLICQEFHVNEEWLRTGNGEMFVEDKYSFAHTIALHFDKFTEFDRILITTYMQLSQEERDHFEHFFYKVCSQAMNAKSKSDLFNSEEEINDNKNG